MPLPDQPAHEEPPHSLAARLRQRLGTDVDPRVSLPGANDEDGRAARVLNRLETRAPSGSRYRMHGEIARGGMGAILEVFDEDLRRRLAMKVIVDRRTQATGTDSRSVDPAQLARFLEEAQVTGQLDHPGIVPVHELGLDANGQVYFTMRLVHGRDLEAIFDLVARGLEGWSTMRALGVLQKVCEALSYAHEKGVVHRDIKPANVMVGRFGEVYVMDWGLARVRDHVERHDVRIQAETKPNSEHTPAAQSMERVATDRREASHVDTEDALHTMDGDVVGTPSYMAPEQARGQIAALDERTDVYAVGAMLYRLIAGQAPYTTRGEAVSAVEIWRRVLAGPPAELEAIAPTAPPELVAIATKAMQREPAARYPDVEALSEDLRAFLEGRVVHAFETGAFAEAKKWVRRNRPLAGAVAAGLLALLAGLVFSLIFADRAQKSAALAEVRRQESDANAALASERRVEADQSAKLAEERSIAADASATAARREAKIASEVNSFLNDDLLSAMAPEHQGVDVKVRTVLDLAAFRLTGRFADEPAVESALRTTIAKSYSRLGKSEEALKHFRRALELRTKSAGPRSEKTLQSMMDVAEALHAVGKTDEAIALGAEAETLSRDIMGEEHRATLSAVNNLALFFMQVGRRAEARAKFEEILPIQVRLFGPDNDNTLTTETNIAVLDHKEGRLVAAAERMRHVFERRRDTLGKKDPETIDAQSRLSALLCDIGDYAGSEREARESLTALRESVGPDHPRTATAAGNLARALLMRGRVSQAEPLFADALRILRATFGEEHPRTLAARHNHAASIVSPARLPEVLELHRGIYADRLRIFGPKHLDTLESQNSLAIALKDSGALDEALQMLRDLVAVHTEILGTDHPTTIVVRENLAGVLLAMNDCAASVPIVREVLEARRRVLGEAHPDVTKSMFNLSVSLKCAGDVEGALQLLLATLERARAMSDKKNPLASLSLRSIGDIHISLERLDEARSAYEEALAIQRAYQDDDTDAGYLLHQIGYCLYKADDFEGGLKAVDEAYSIRERLLGRDAPGTRASLYLRCCCLTKLKRFAEAEPGLVDVIERIGRAPKVDEAWKSRAQQLLDEVRAEIQATAPTAK